MPLNTLRENRSKHFSGRAAKLASCLPAYSDREKQVSSHHKNIMLHVPATKQEI